MEHIERAGRLSAVKVRALILTIFFSFSALFWKTLSQTEILHFSYGSMSDRKKEKEKLAGKVVRRERAEQFI